MKDDNSTFGPSRRSFLLIALAATAGGSACSRAPLSPWRFLTIYEARTLTAVCERIIPADEYPGAAWAGVVRYIDRQLAGHFIEHRKAYREGIAGLNRRAGGRFEVLEATKQDELLRSIEKDAQLGPFFSLAIAHTIQGFYGSPRHGGNHDWTSWRMLGVPISPSRGRDLYDFTAGGRS